MDRKRERPTLPNGRLLLGSPDKQTDYGRRRVAALLEKAKSLIDSGEFDKAIETAKTAKMVAASSYLADPPEAADIYRIANAKAGILHLDMFQMLLQKFAENSGKKMSVEASLESMQGYVAGSGADASAFDRLSDSVNRLRKIPSEPPMK